MKIRVIRASDHAKEVISVIGPLAVTEGNYLSNLHSAEGMDHYFTPDGYYDGWGLATACSFPEASEKIEQIEKDREIDSGSKR